MRACSREAREFVAGFPSLSFRQRVAASCHLGQPAQVRHVRHRNGTGQVSHQVEHEEHDDQVHTRHFERADEKQHPRKRRAPATPCEPDARKK